MSDTAPVDDAPSAHASAPTEPSPWAAGSPGAPEAGGPPSAHPATFLVREIGTLGRELESAMREHLTVNPTDLRAMSALLGRGPMTVSELADEIGLGRPSTSMSVDRLVHLGHVTRERDAHDRRRVTIRATPGSAAKARGALLPMIREIDALMDPMTEDERRLVNDYLSAVAGAMQRQIDSIRTDEETDR